MATKVARPGVGLGDYYRAKIEELEVRIRDRQHNLSRMEAQRNELNTKGEKAGRRLPLACCQAGDRGAMANEVCPGCSADASRGAAAAARARQLRGRGDQGEPGAGGAAAHGFCAPRPAEPTWWSAACVSGGQVMGKNKVLVKVNPEGKYVVDLDKEIDIGKIVPGARVALRNDSYQLHVVLPTKVGRRAGIEKCGLQLPQRCVHRVAVQRHRPPLPFRASLPAVGSCSWAAQPSAAWMYSAQPATPARHI